LLISQTIVLIPPSSGEGVGSISPRHLRTT
jgi:hypothetical protein